MFEFISNIISRKTAKKKHELIKTKWQIAELQKKIDKAKREQN